MVASSTGWAWLLELILNLIPHKLLQGLFKSTTPTSANWACLPELALNLILHKLQELPDCVRFASVCTTWRIAAKNSGNMQFPVPMLRVQLPFDDDTFRFRGSSHGWLIKVESVSSIILSSPTTKNPQRATIHLPPITITSISDLLSKFWSFHLLDMASGACPHKSTMATSNDWELLPELVLNLILHKLQELPDCVRFASVCTTWRVAAKNTGNKQFQVPMLSEYDNIFRMVKASTSSIARQVQCDDSF